MGKDSVIIFRKSLPMLVLSDLHQGGLYQMIFLFLFFVSLVEFFSLGHRLV